jgi:hypothetical protein
MFCKRIVITQIKDREKPADLPNQHKQGRPMHEGIRFCARIHMEDRCSRPIKLYDRKLARLAISTALTISRNCEGEPKTIDFSDDFDAPARKVFEEQLFTRLRKK